MTKEAKALAAWVGVSIEHARERAGMSKRGLSRALSVNPSYVGLMESGRRLPSLEMLFKVAAVLKVHAAELLPTRSP